MYSVEEIGDLPEDVVNVLSDLAYFIKQSFIVKFLVVRLRISCSHFAGSCTVPLGDLMKT